MPTQIETLTAKVADLHSKQEAALAAADAEGVSPEDRAKHLAEFDRLDEAKAEANASLGRARKLADEKAAMDREPARPPIVQPPAAPQGTVARETLPAKPRAHGVSRVFQGADAHGRAEAFGLWVAATQYGSQKHARYLAEHYGIVPQATLGTVSNSSAAYFVPQELSTDILKLQELYGVFRRNTRVIQMGSETWRGPRWTIGLTATWVAQGSAPSQSEQGYDQIEMVAKDLAVYGKQTRQLNEDAIISLADEWAEAAAVAFSDAEDNAAFNGDGTSTYGGVTGLFTKVIASANAASLYTATGHTTLGALTMADFSAVIGKFPAYPGAMPKWYCHKSVWANSMLPLMLASGGATPGDYAGPTHTSFLGYPVEFTQKAPASGSVTTGVTGILFGDLRMAAALGDRRQRTLESGMINDDLIKQLQTFFAASRVDVNVHTVVDPKNSSNPGPVIGLKLG